MSQRRRTLAVVITAVLGIALAAAITWSTSQLVRQRIGLASEPLTAGSRLIPAGSAGATTTGTPPTRTTRSKPRKPATRSPTTSTPGAGSGTPSTTPAPVQEPQPSVTAIPGAQESPAPARGTSSTGDERAARTNDASAHRDD